MEGAQLHQGRGVPLQVMSFLLPCDRRVQVPLRAGAWTPTSLESRTRPQFDPQPFGSTSRGTRDRIAQQLRPAMVEANCLRHLPWPAVGPTHAAMPLRFPRGSLILVGCTRAEPAIDAAAAG